MKVAPGASAPEPNKGTPLLKAKLVMVWLDESNDKVQITMSPALIVVCIPLAAKPQARFTVFISWVVVV